MLKNDSWEAWRASVDVLRAKGLRFMPVHVDSIERHLDQHPPDTSVMGLVLIDDAALRSFTWARLQSGIPLLVE